MAPEETKRINIKTIIPNSFLFHNLFLYLRQIILSIYKKGNIL